MKITLRKANRIRNKLQNVKSKLAYEISNMTTTSINVFDPEPTKQLLDKEIIARQQYAKFSVLTKTVHVLRELIGTANQTSGIDTLLNHIAELKDRKSLVSQWTVTSPRLTDEQILARVAGASSDSAVSARRHNEDMQLYVLSHQFISELNFEEKELSRMLDGAQDSLEYLNSSTMIDITDLVNVLTNEGLL